MRNQCSLLKHLSPLVLVLSLFAFVTLSTNALAQQSLADRVIPSLDDGAGGGICGNVTDGILAAAACVSADAADEQAEAAIQFSGNTAAAAGSNATQTTIAQVDAQTSRLAAVRAQASVGDGFRSGSEGGIDTSRMGGFFNGFGGFGDMQRNGEEPGFEYEGGGFTSGVDYRLSDNLVLGGGFGWNRQVNDYDQEASVTGAAGGVGGGDLTSDSFVFSTFGSWFDGPLYLDAMLSYTYVEYEAKRNIIAPSRGISGQADSESDGHQAGVTLGGGYQQQFRGLTFGPTLQMNYLYTRIEDYRENGFNLALSYEDQEIETLTTSLGGEVLYPISTKAGVVTPYLRLSWEHELMDDPRKIRARFVLDDSGASNPITTETSEPDRNYGRISVGASTQLKGGLSAFLDYETVLGLRHVEAHKFSFGGRMEF